MQMTQRLDFADRDLEMTLTTMTKKHLQEKTDIMMGDIGNFWTIDNGGYRRGVETLGREK